ncbi:MAG: HIT family protein [Planctomycetota bacterium]|nr:HIT family protein [Planctomycetota bacterium]
MSEDSIFTKIVRGDLPCYKLFEDDLTLAFLDINPVSKGHCLVICKEEYQYIEDVPDEMLGALIKSVKRVGQAMTTALGGKDYNLIVNNGPIAGQEVPHVHFHIVPREPGDGLRTGWKQGKLNNDEAKDLAESVRKALSN